MRKLLVVTLATIGMTLGAASAMAGQDKAAGQSVAPKQGHSAGGGGCYDEYAQPKQSKPAA